MNKTSGKLIILMIIGFLLGSVAGYFLDEAIHEKARYENCFKQIENGTFHPEKIYNFTEKDLVYAGR